MIITRTPLRISLFGGGTDMEAFYRQGVAGAVLSFTIDKYIYISVNPKFDGRTRVSYSRTEEVESVEELQHDLVRETLLHLNRKRLEITSISDIPGEGSGLGSSSAFLVGLTLAMTRWVNPQMAYTIERKLCAHPVGKQDAWACAYGGVNHFTFQPDGTVATRRLEMDTEALERNLMLFYLGNTRKASPILLEQEGNLRGKQRAYECGVSLKCLADEMAERFANNDLSDLGYHLGESWKWKKNMADSITSPQIDEIYRRALWAGAEGGKVCGAGGGGFILFHAEGKYQDAVRKAVRLRQVPFHIEQKGSQVIYES